jgi:hypothetical protein
MTIIIHRKETIVVPIVAAAAAVLVEWEMLYTGNIFFIHA